MKRIVVSSLLLLAFTLCGCNNTSKPSYKNDVEDRDITSIEQFKNLCHGKTSVPITEDITICGIVTGNDYLGEFFKTIIIEDSSSGIEIHIDNGKLADKFPLNTLVTVYCNGLSLGDYGGKIVLGAHPTGKYSVDRIKDIDNYVSVIEFDVQTQKPPTVKIEDIKSSKYTDRLIHLKDVEFVDSHLSWCDSEIDEETGKDELITTMRRIRDSKGSEINIRTHYKCDYAKDPLPKGVGSIYGIVSYFNREYYVHITNKNINF